MGRTRRVEGPNSLVASAARIRSGKDLVNYSRLGSSSGWQEQAWKMYRIVGEFRYSCDWVGNTLSKALLFPTFESPGGRTDIVATGPAAEWTDQLAGDSDGKAEMLRLIGIHLTVAGECWIVGWTDADEYGVETDRWEVAAAGALKKAPGEDGRYTLHNKEIPVHPDDVLSFRIWRPDPKDPEKATSPARAVLSILGEIVRLTDHVAAQVDSRLAGAGILLAPSEMSLPAPPSAEPREGEPAPIQRSANSAEDLMAIIRDTMAAAIEDRSNASALVPIIITAPGDVIDKVKHVTFWTQLDEHAIELRNEAIRRLALGLDMPPEVLQGVADTNHWSAWQVDESAIKSHTEPLLKLITSALAEGYLRPLLYEDASIAAEDIPRYSIKADTSEMRVRPNRSKEAMELYDRGELNGKALRRETGFDEEDAMDENERALFFLRKVAGGSTTPELVEAALRALNVPLGDVAREAPAAETQEERPVPSLVDHPVRAEPDRERGERRKEIRDRENNPALVAACEQVVIRALERAGNKLKNRMQARPTVAAAELYRVVPTGPGDYARLLDDAWAQVPMIAKRHNLDIALLERNLDAYCRMLMGSREAHDYDRFAEYLQFGLFKMEATA
jgi:hypothetical protein